jgi:hypothetical protein
LRLSLVSGSPIPSTDQTGKSTLYYTPYVNNLLSLYAGGRFVLNYCDEIALPLTLTSGKNYDVFAFTSSATPSSTNTGTEVLTFAGATGWATGSEVTADATGGGLTAGTNYFYRAASATTGSLYDTLAHALAGGATGLVNLTASITATLNAISLELGAAWTDDTTRADALATLAGIFVKSADNTRLWLGTIRASGTNTTEDSDANRYVANFYNAVHRRLYCSPGYTDDNALTTYTFSNTASWAEANGGTGSRVSFLAPLDGWMVNAVANWALKGSATGTALGALGFDSTSNAFSLVQAPASTSTFGMMTAYAAPCAAGKHFIAMLNLSTGGTGTVNVDTSRATGATSDPRYTYFLGWVMG